MERRDASGITTRLILDLVRARAGEEGVAKLLEVAGETRPLEVLEKPLVWSSHEQRTRLFEAGAEVTGDEDFAWATGASFMVSRTTVLLRALLGRFGSVPGLMRALPIAHSKFDTAYRSRLIELREGYARLGIEAKPGYDFSPHDCRYLMGLLSQAPVLFGLAPGRVRQVRCAADGLPECEVEVAWQVGRRRWRRQQSVANSTVDVLETQLKDFQATLADLMETEGVNEVLQRVTEHAGFVVTAQQLLLAVRIEGHDLPHVHAEGLSDAEAERLGAMLLETGELPPGASGHERREMLVARIASPARDYGRLVAFSSAPFVDSEQHLLESYARLAATALDSTTALGLAAARRETAERLGVFAARLIREQDTQGIADATVGAALDVMGSSRATLMRYDPGTGSFATISQTGQAPGHSEAISNLVIGPDNYPLLSEGLERLDHPVIRGAGAIHPEVRALFEQFRLEKVAVAPVRTRERQYGLLFTSFESGSRVSDVELAEQVRLLSGIADQAAGAWEKALLLEQVHRQASVDSLTGLANRRVFTEILADLLARPGAAAVAVVFCDLDRFKSVNDLLGHAAGDDLLVEVGRRLTRCVRPDDLVARLGGDEFTVLLRDVDDEWSPQVFAGRVRAAMTEPITIEGSRVFVHLSIGSVVATPGTATVKEVLRKADAAMYAAKSRGGDRLLTFEEDMLVERSERLEIEAALATAVSDLGQFLVLYQPQVELSTGRIVGVEALVRWRHPVLGLLAPDRFLAVAEETGIVVPLDLHVLRTALAQVTLWRERGLELRVAVNFSVRTLQADGLVASIGQMLEGAGVTGERLEIEVTESSAVADPESLSDILRAIGGLGVSVAIDDVGTGYSSLALLHKLPAQRLKIDRSFVQRITDDSTSRSVVEAVLLLADRLGQTVVAEGIETAEQAMELKALGCQFAQGYLFARPVDPAEVIALASGGSLLTGLR